MTFRKHRIPSDTCGCGFDLGARKFRRNELVCWSYCPRCGPSREQMRERYAGWLMDTFKDQEWFQEERRRLNRETLVRLGIRVPYL